VREAQARVRYMNKWKGIIQENTTQVPSKDINHTPSTSIHKINTKKKEREKSQPISSLSFLCHSHIVSMKDPTLQKTMEKWS